MVGHRGICRIRSGIRLQADRPRPGDRLCQGFGELADANAAADGGPHEVSRARGAGWGAVSSLALGLVMLGGAVRAVGSQQNPASPSPPATPPAVQAPVAEPAPPAPADAFTFPSGAGMIFWIVKPEEAEAFELVWSVIRGRLADSQKPELRAIDASLTIFQEEPVPGQDASYIFLVDPAAKGTSYSVTPFLLFESGLFERPEADELFATLQKATVRVNPVAVVSVK
jgi:hypothetical protein